LAYAGSGVGFYLLAPQSIAAAVWAMLAFIVALGPPWEGLRGLMAAADSRASTFFPIDDELREAALRRAAASMAGGLTVGAVASLMIPSSIMGFLCGSVAISSALPILQWRNEGARRQRRGGGGRVFRQSWNNASEGMPTAAILWAASGVLFAWAIGSALQWPGSGQWQSLSDAWFPVAAGIGIASVAWAWFRAAARGTEVEEIDGELPVPSELGGGFRPRNLPLDQIDTVGPIQTRYYGQEILPVGMRDGTVREFLVADLRAYTNAQGQTLLDALIGTAPPHRAEGTAIGG
jgi:hypothetical protein